jgi:hypothetical protein
MHALQVQDHLDCQGHLFAKTKESLMSKFMHHGKGGGGFTQCALFQHAAL